MKKLFITICSIVATAIVVLCCVFPISSGIDKKRLGEAELYSNSYVDYAKDVKFDTKKYPELADQGLFWTRYNKSSREIEVVKADTAEGAKLVDTKKPTIMLVHGVMLNDGYINREQYIANPRIARVNDFGLDGQTLVNMNYVYLQKGYNVANFSYNLFADEANVLAAPKIIEGKVWSAKGQEGTRFRKPGSDKYSDKAVTNYSISEHFVADYLRALNLLDETMGQSGIQFAGHSMGGEVVTVGAFLLTELIGLDMIPSRYMPNRVTLMDSYFGAEIDLGSNSDILDFMSNKNLEIRWSGKKMPKQSVGTAMLGCLKDINASGTVVEYITNDESFLNMAAKNILVEMKKICVYTTIINNYPDAGYEKMSQGHNGVREWYLLSKLYDAPKLVGSGRAPSASTPIQELKSFVGREFIQTAGIYTLTAVDDVFKEIK